MEISKRLGLNSEYSTLTGSFLEFSLLQFQNKISFCKYIMYLIRSLLFFQPLTNQGSPSPSREGNEQTAQHRPTVPWPAGHPLIPAPTPPAPGAIARHLRIAAPKSINSPVVGSQGRPVRACPSPKYGARPSLQGSPENGNNPPSDEPVGLRLTGGLCRDISGRHKEILTEIFYFRKNPDIPPDYETAQEPAVSSTDDLSEFLRLNDLEKYRHSKDGWESDGDSGHVFQETTLPKVQNVAVNATAEAPSSTTPTVPKTGVPAAPTTPQTSTSAVPAQPPSSGSGRMVTRVSSGAIRHKSVGELLGQQEVQPRSNDTN
jgi:hypothetical protein